ncbi:unnamed protein product [Meganyctiphanes norvegica]|uniref:Uncharacterized protein n=1 Tax=Meganyctiphanes norvegica TaxID=48144 RepID=A0AAV2SPP7_MEGNR
MDSHKCVVSQCFVFFPCNCCCGLTLRTGSLIFGVLSLIGDGIIACLAGLATSASFAVGAGGIGSLWLFATFIAVVHFIASSMLLIGISNNNVKFIKAYVYANVAVIVLYVILVIVLLSYADFNRAVSYLVYILFMIYEAIVVRSYALQIEEGNQAPITGMA